MKEEDNRRKEGDRKPDHLMIVASRMKPDTRLSLVTTHKRERCPQGMITGGALVRQARAANNTPHSLRKEATAFRRKRQSGTPGTAVSLWDLLRVVQLVRSLFYRIKRLRRHKRSR